MCKRKGLQLKKITYCSVAIYFNSLFKVCNHLSRSCIMHKSSLLMMTQSLYSCKVQQSISNFIYNRSRMKKNVGCLTQGLTGWNIKSTLNNCERCSVGQIMGFKWFMSHFLPQEIIMDGPIFSTSTLECPAMMLSPSPVFAVSTSILYGKCIL